MSFDAHANLAVSLVTLAPAPAVSGDTLTVVSGQGVRFPVPPFNVTIWAAGEMPTPVNAEVARVTARVGDTLTLIRAAEPGAPARTILVGDLIAETVTAKALQDIESGVNFPNLASETDLTVPGLSTLHFVTAQALDVAADATIHGQLLVEGDLRVDGPSVLNGQVLVTGNLQASGTITADGGFTTGGEVSAATGTFTGTLTAQDLNVQQVNATDINVTHLDADTISATTSVTAPLGQFGGLGTTPLHATNLTTGTVPDARLSVNVLKHTGGYPGGSTTFLRADGTFAAASGGGPPALHAPTHASGGTDPVTVTTLAGYPGGSTLFLRADGTFALPPGGGGVAAHHLTHETGGTDPVVNLSAAVITSGTLADARLSTNVALENVANQFTTQQQISSVSPGVNLTETDQPAGQKNWQIIVNAQDLKVVACDDGFTQLNTGFVVHRNASVATEGSVFGQLALITNGAATVGTDLLFTGGVNHSVRPDTVDGGDVAALYLCGGGALGSTRGASIGLVGNEVGGGPLTLTAGEAGPIDFQTGPAGTLRGRMQVSGGFTWGTAGDPGPTNMVVAGLLMIGGTTASSAAMRPGAGPALEIVTATQSQWATCKALNFLATGSGNILPDLTVTTLAVTNQSCSGILNVGGGGRSGVKGVDINMGANGIVGLGTDIGSAFNMLIFYTPSGVAGYIQTSAATTAYGTASDARLKTDRGPLVSDVLARTRIHAFDWTADGTPGRGVFAQEAVEVAPFAVAVGTDEVDEQGRLTHPWAVDYAKYVPDLIAGWQAHAAALVALRAELAALKAALGEA